MFKVVSDFANTEIVFADSNGPYVINGGTPVTLTAGAPNAHATYQWDLGDGTTASTPSVVHTYGSDGVYVAKLTVTVNQPGGDISQHYAQIEVINVPPVVNAGPSHTVKEGDIDPFTGTFSDVQWLETHTAMWDWNDPQKPTPGVVTETHSPPIGQGTVTGSHAWGHSGNYTVTLRVKDKGGAVGQGTTLVKVLNVPPTVSAGSPMFAYPCTVLTLEGKFTDPGWFDVHAGFWDFGDCTGLQKAVVREKHEPPAGTGVAISSHIYHECGTYLVTCTVIDDDGGVGNDSTVVRVVDIQNKRFEDGYCLRQLGAVANHWQPYLAPLPLLGAADNFTLVRFTDGSDIFLAEHNCVHYGQKSQRIRFSGMFRAGIFQSVGANPGWDYQVSVWYSLNEQAGGVSKLLEVVNTPADIIPPDQKGSTARLGIDPTGGTDPSSADIVWYNGHLRPEWSQLSVRATATASTITIFLEGQGEGRLGTDVFFDDANLLAVQPFCPTQLPPPPVEVCAGFSDLETREEPSVFVENHFRFTALDGSSQEVVPLGSPVNQRALLVRQAGLETTLPFIADLVRVTLATFEGIPATVTALDSSENRVSEVDGSPTGELQTLTVSGKGITKVIVKSKGQVWIIKICARQQQESLKLT
jgi:PKD repeat protein